ncbi:MAG: SemiSWEET transporter [Candidatus Omnitrophica bacterium]|nr:SemiSWEET transporter [Candidatus Omnitrophota bacterium]
MDYANIVGLIAGAMTTISFLPQAARIYKTRHTSDLSLPTYIVLLAGVFLWLCYGVMVKSYPIIIANAVTMAIGSYILAMKVKYK